MRTTLVLRDDLVKRAMAMTRITERSALVHAGLEALIAAEAARQLAQLGGTDRRAQAGRRRRARKAGSAATHGAGRHLRMD